MRNRHIQTYYLCAKLYILFAFLQKEFRDQHFGYLIHHNDHYMCDTSFRVKKFLKIAFFLFLWYTIYLTRLASMMGLPRVMMVDANDIKYRSKWWKKKWMNQQKEQIVCNKREKKIKFCTNDLFNTHIWIKFPQK